MSNLSDRVLKDLSAALPYYKIREEYYIVYKGYGLYLDFYFPELLVAVEVQGAQHDYFVRHFHTDSSGFKASKFRDSLKKEWAEQNGVRLLDVRESDLPLSASEIFSLISEGRV